MDGLSHDEGRLPAAAVAQWLGEPKYSSDVNSDNLADSPFRVSLTGDSQSYNELKVKEHGDEPGEIFLKD
jgi:hypothetical protein